MDVDDQEDERDRENPTQSGGHESSQSACHRGHEHKDRHHLWPLRVLFRAAEDVDTDQGTQQRHADKAPEVVSQDDDREQKLKAQAPDHGPQFDGTSPVA